LLLRSFPPAGGGNEKGGVFRTGPAGKAGEVYYLHGDHVGSTVLLTDQAGGFVGWAFYDAYGTAITNTIPLTLTNRLYEGRLFDAGVNLVYHGAGRYYDPQIGLRLQPSPAGGPPTLPQALNRYAVPPAQSVVGQAARVSFLDAVASFIWEGSVDTGVDSVAWATGQMLGLGLNAIRPLGYLEASISGTVISRAKLRDFFQRVGRSQGLWSPKFRSPLLRQLGRGAYEEVASGNPVVLQDIQDILQKSLGPGTVRRGMPEFAPRSGLYAKLYSGLDWERTAQFTGKKFTGADVVGGSLIGFIFDTGLEYARLANNPHLTPGQKWRRAGIVGLTGVGYGLGVIATVGTGGTAFVVSLVIGWTAEKWTADFIISLLPGLQGQRRFLPLP
jgi:hypothetical protein